MSAGYEALTTKVKAMYGKRLRYADFVRLSKLGSVSEIYADLRQHPVWGGAAARLTEEGKFGRARLEAALREQVREEYVRLTGFIPRKDRALMDFPVLRSELDGLLFTLTRLQAGRIKEIEPLPTRFILHSRTDESALPVCTDYDGLLDAAKESIYYDTLLSLRPADGGLPDYTIAESMLFAVYYSHMMDVAKKRYDGDVRKMIQTRLGTQVDLLNIMHILRMKRFFPDEDNFLTILYPFNYKLKPEQVRAMCAAEGVDGVMAVLAETPYAKTFRNVGVDELGHIYNELLFRLSRRQLMMGQPSIYSAVAFLNLRELELKELVTVIETVKYQADYDDRFAKVLGA